MIVRKRYNGNNLVWEFEMETPGEAMDIVLIMRRGIHSLQEQLKDDDALRILQVWDKAIGLLAHANPEKDEVFEWRQTYPEGGSSG